MSELLGVSAVDSPGLAGVEERGQSVEPRLSEEADVCAVFGCNNDRLLPEKYTVKDHISNTKLEKGDHYWHPNTAQGSFSTLQSYSKKTLRKNVPKRARKYKRNVLMPPEHPIILHKSN